MENKNIWTIIAIAVMAVLGLFIVGRNGDGGNGNYPDLMLALSPVDIHPPAQIATTINDEEFPDGTVYEWTFNGNVVGVGKNLSGRVGGWPAIFSVDALLDGKLIGEASAALGLINERPLFNNFWTPSLPEGGAFLGFHLYHRWRGCDAAGSPTAITGISDPDHTAADPSTDLTDRWEYQVLVVDRETGFRENVYYVGDDGSINLMGPDDWTTDPRFVWTPWVKVGDSPSVPVTAYFFPNIPPRSNISPAGVRELESELDSGYSWARPTDMSAMAVIAKGCVPIDPGDTTQVPTGKANKQVIIRVREWSYVYEVSYLLYARLGTCDPY